MAAPLSGDFTIQQKSNGRYLDAHQGSNDNSVVTRNAQGNSTQVWTITPVGNKEYTIQQKSNGRYLDAHVVNSDDFFVVTRDRQNNDTQVWRMIAGANGTYTIQQKHNGRFMDAHQGSNDNSVVTRDFQNNGTQSWKITRVAVAPTPLPPAVTGLSGEYHVQQKTRVRTY